MTDITTSDDNCVDGFVGDVEYTSGVFDDDSNTRHFYFENENQQVVNDSNDSNQRVEVGQVDSDVSDCDVNYDNVERSTENKFKKQKRVKVSKEKLILKCSWGDCKWQEEKFESFIQHVTLHIRDVAVREIDEDTEIYTCLWQSCVFNTTVADEIKRHVNFHSYHTKLKCIGKNVKARIDLPDCLYNQTDASQIPDTLDPYKCCWSDCKYEGSSIQNFIFHVTTHTRECAATRSFKCEWKGCGNSFININKLTCHVRVHTKEKLVACPDCGGMFSSNTKFVDHCKRQLPYDKSRYECAHCFKLYSSERILRDHMRSHINVHKCIYCDMTCANRFTLAAHIRHRHLKAKPFRCTSCNYRCETNHDLLCHLRVHDDKYKLACEEPDCNFKCRSKLTMKQHILQEHEGVEKRVYECHECGKQFSRGVHLTYHLMARHNLHWPSGHKRFSYRPDEDGKFKLQRIRYESLDATEQMSSNRTNLSDEEDLMDNEDDPESKDSNDKRILITVDEVNESCQKIIVEYSTEEILESLPEGGTIIAECDS